MTQIFQYIIGWGFVLKAYIVIAMFTFLMRSTKGRGKGKLIISILWPIIDAIIIAVFLWVFFKMVGRLFTSLFKKKFLII
jgi:chromate transport protein ChrA